MKNKIYSIVIITLVIGTDLFGQKIIKSSDLDLSTPFTKYVDIVGLDYLENKGLLIYSWQPITGRVLEKTTKKDIGVTGSPYFEEKIIDHNLSLVSQFGEFVSVKELDKSKEYIFTPSLGEQFPVKSSLTDIFKKYQQFEMIKTIDIKAKWTDNGSISMKKQTGYPDIVSTVLFPNNSNGTYELKKIIEEKYIKENSEKFISYLRGCNTNSSVPVAIQVGDNKFQAILTKYDSEKSFAESYMNYKIISFFGNGKVDDIHDLPLKYTSEPESFIPVYTENGGINGSILVFKDFNAGSKKLRNPNSNGYYLIISDKNGHVILNQEFTYGEKGKAISLYHAYKVGENYYIENINNEKKGSFEIIEIAKEGKISTINTISKSFPSIGTENDELNINDSNYFNEVKTILTSTDYFYLISQRKIQKVANGDWMYGNIIINVFKKDFSNRTTYVIGRQRRTNPSVIDLINYSSKETKVLLKDDKNQLITLQNDGIGKIVDFTPKDYTLPNSSILSKNYIRIGNTNQYYFLFYNANSLKGNVSLIEFD